MSRLYLTGCVMQPLGSYLKSLGILRLVAEQQPEARGFWGDECFVLDSPLDEAELVRFFLEEYRPTPLIAPWNGGSGFYPKDRKVGINAIEGSEAARFSDYREAIAAARAIPELAQAQKGAAKADEDARRLTILRELRNRVPDTCVEWLDAAVAICADGSRAFAPILGTGGNEGRLDYTNNFMENLSRLLIAPDGKTPVKALLEHAIFGRDTAGLLDIAVGQYDPGRAGGFNQGQGIEAASAANPWNAVLAMEGAVAWAGGIYRKQGISYRSFLCSPFTVRPSAVGYGSAAEKDEATARAEIWTPLWSRPARWGEIRSLLREGRASLDGKNVENGLEFAQAAASLGVDRAISGFVRYSLQKRRGDSYIALPTGKFGVSQRALSDLARELGPILEQAERAVRGRGKEVPNSWPPLVRKVEEAEYSVLLRDTPELLVDLAAAVGCMHRWLLSREVETWLPRRLREDWIACCAPRAEVRIAAALASLEGSGGGIRCNLARSHKDFSWTGRDLAERMLSTLRRRMLAAGGGSEEAPRTPFQASYRASLADVNRFLEGEVNDGLIDDLLHAFVLVERTPRRPAEADREQPWPAYALLKLLFLPDSLRGPEGDIRLTPDPRIAPLLSGARGARGDAIAEACAMARRQLRVAGFAPVDGEFLSGLDPRRLGAALLIPVAAVERLIRSATTEQERERDLVVD